MSDGNTLKCSYGTSKYCANFLANAQCEVHETKGTCPFIHELERRRDKVIEDDNEFKDYLAVQDKIATDFCFKLGLFNQTRLSTWSFHSGLPGPSDMLGLQMGHILERVPS
jgi:hypothetical protein